MEEHLSELAGILAAGTGMTSLVFIALLVVAYALRTLATALGQRDIEDYKSALTREIEHLRADLTATSETRRLVAKLKVEALIKFAIHAQQFYSDAHNRPFSDPAAQSQIVDALHEGFRLAKTLEPLVPVRLYNRFSDFFSQTHTLASRMRSGDETAYHAALSGFKETMNLVRSELGVPIE